MNNEDLCNQNEEKSNHKTQAATPLIMPLDSPSPSLFHRGRFIDQSTPVTLEPPQSFPSPGQSIPSQDRQSVSSATDDADYQQEFRHELYTVLEERMLKQAEAKQMVRTSSF